MERFDFNACQQAVSESVANSCRDRELTLILELLDSVAGQAELLIEQHPSDRSQIDCGPGCSSCCVVNVSTLMPEGLAIVAYLKQRGKQQVRRAVEQLEQLWCRVRGLDDEDRLFVRSPCAFLDENGRCGIYPVRPLLCRSVTSTSAAGCRDALSGKLLGEETTVLMHQFQQQLYELLFSSIAKGLEASGLDGRSFQLAGLIRYLLKHPRFGSDWLNGQRLSWQDLY